MAKTVVGLMDTAAEAERVVRDLTATCGCEREDIGLMARDAEEAAGDVLPDRGGDAGARGSNMARGAMKGAGTGAAVGGVLGLVAGVASLSIPGLGPFIAAGPIAAALAGAGVGAAAGGIIGALTNIGVPEEEAHHYAEGVRRGGTLLTVHARTDAIAECAANVMRQHGAVNIDERSQQWRQEGWSGRLTADDPAARAGQSEVLPVAQEELVVGKRNVSQGGVRVESHVTETPVEKTVDLREEHVNVDRRPVDRPVDAGDDLFKDRTIEVRETVEEPVVTKQARVVEEVRVGKEAVEHQETVRETVRHTEVEIDRGNTGQARSGRTSAPRYTGVERRRADIPYSGVERRVLH